MAVIVAVVGYFGFVYEPPRDEPLPDPTAAQRAADEEAAAQLVRDEVAQSDKAEEQGTTAGTRLPDLVSPQMLASTNEYLAELQAAGMVSSGTTEVVDVSMTDWTDQVPEAGARRLRLEVCLDHSGTTTTALSGAQVQRQHPNGQPFTSPRKQAEYVVMAHADGRYVVQDVYGAFEEAPC